MVTTPVTIPIQQIQLTPGSAITIAGITWEQYEAILTEFGEARSTRIAYNDGILEIMSPLPAHERPNRLIGYIVTTLLDAQAQDWEDFGSTTMKQQAKAVGLEPDTCFYIQNAQQVRQCMTSLDLSLYPPPDLAIETDVTSKTTLAAYEAIAIPEVWIYSTGKLTIHVLKDSHYIETTISPTFPTLSITTFIPHWVQHALQVGTSQMLRNLRHHIAQGQLEL